MKSLLIIVLALAAAGAACAGGVPLGTTLDALEDLCVCMDSGLTSNPPPADAAPAAFEWQARDTVRYAQAIGGMARAVAAAGVPALNGVANDLEGVAVSGQGNAPFWAAQLAGVKARLRGGAAQVAAVRAGLDAAALARPVPLAAALPALGRVLVASQAPAAASFEWYRVDGVLICEMLVAGRAVLRIAGTFRGPVRRALVRPGRALVEQYEGGGGGDDYWKQKVERELAMMREAAATLRQVAAGEGSL